MPAVDPDGASSAIAASEATRRGSATTAVTAMYAKSLLGRPQIVAVKRIGVGERRRQAGPLAGGRPPAPPSEPA